MNQSSSIEIPNKKTTHIEVSSSRHQRRSHPTLHDSGLSPTYYTSDGIIQPNNHQEVNDNLGSPVFDDKTRIFFPHRSECSCKSNKECIFFLYSFHHRSWFGCWM